jgi:NAD(P)-dependent dehydrogenase (short-subunit alcohol dehydrogenase family)
MIPNATWAIWQGYTLRVKDRVPLWDEREPMRILIIGATGPIGRAVVEQLTAHHQIVKAGRSHGDVRVDIRSRESVSQLFREAGLLDAIVCAAGHVHFDPLDRMTFDKFEIGLQDKLMGQVNLVLAGQASLNNGGSFTLTSSSCSEIPIRGGTGESMVDGAIESFVRAAAIELPRGLRINAVSPTILQESMELYGHYFCGYEPVSAQRVALAYAESIGGSQTGQVYKVW